MQFFRRCAYGRSANGRPVQLTRSWSARSRSAAAECAACRPAAAAIARRGRRPGASDRPGRRDRADGRRGQAVVDDPVGTARDRQDQHRATARRRGRPALRRRSRRSSPASPTSRRSSPRRKTAARAGQRTLLFVDEIHRFNRAQQDGFLPYVEDGTVTLVGATTENPSFELNAALLSRCQVLILRRLDHEALGNPDRAAPRARGRPPCPADRRSARRADRQRRRRRPLPAQPGRDLVRRRRSTSRSTRPGWRRCCTAASRSTTRTARAITTSSRRFTKACAARTRRRRFIISRGCSSPARSRSTCCAA